jgi:hypothetical protein
VRTQDLFGMADADPLAKRRRLAAKRSNTAIPKNFQLSLHRIVTVDNVASPNTLVADESTVGPIAPFRFR